MLFWFQARCCNLSYMENILLTQVTIPKEVSTAQQGFAEVRSRGPRPGGAEGIHGSAVLLRPAEPPRRAPCSPCCGHAGVCSGLPDGPDTSPQTAFARSVDAVFVKPDEVGRSVGQARAVRGRNAGASLVLRELEADTHAPLPPARSRAPCISP